MSKRYYEAALEKARANDGDVELRVSMRVATIEHLRSLASLEGITVEDDGFRILIHRGQPSRGEAASTWLESVQEASAQEGEA